MLIPESCETGDGHPPLAARPADRLIVTECWLSVAHKSNYEGWKELFVQLGKVNIGRMFQESIRAADGGHFCPQYLIGIHTRPAPTISDTPARPY